MRADGSHSSDQKKT
jgi:hypothetical protein